MIDLHLHTTASDGLLTPRELVEKASIAGLTVMAVTDHDTAAAVPDVRAAARDHGIETISGIEITAVENGRDVHVLGYFFDPQNVRLADFLASQRAARTARVEAIAARLASLGVPIDAATFVNQSSGGSRSIGRPQIARAMVEAGHVADTREAFDRWLGFGCPAFVPRSGTAAETVIDIIHRAGGIASLAHPGKTRIDARLGPLKDAGLDALEAFHPDHDDDAVQRYVSIARQLGLCLTGGSDFHGDPAYGLTPGSVTLPAEEWARLVALRPPRREVSEV